MKQWNIETKICGSFRFVRQELRQDSIRNTKYGPYIVYNIFINSNWVVIRWQWLFYMYTEYEIGY